MSQETISLFVPSEVFEIRAEVSPSDALTELEQLVLRAISEGVEHFDTLKAIFGLPERPLLDLLLDLFHAGHIELDHATSTIHISAAAKSKDFEELTSGKVTQQKLFVMRELVSGHLMPVQPRPLRLTDSHTAPQAGHLVRGVFPESARDELLSVVTRMVRKTPAGREQVLRNAFPAGDLETGRSTQTHFRFLQVYARVTRHPDLDDLVFQIVEPSTLPTKLRAAMARQLGEMGREMPDEIFFKQLRVSITARRGAVEDSLPAALERLRTRVSSLSETDPGVMRERHQSCEDAAADVREFVSEEIERRADVHVLAGADEINASIVEQIRNARHQVVLVCPFVHRDGYLRLRATLKQLLDERPVQIFVLWGIGPDDTIDARFARGLDELKKAAKRGSLYYAKVSARTHAKLVIRDGDMALIGSWNFLSHLGAPKAEVAVLIRSGEGQVSQTVLEYLQWVREIYPDFTQGSAIYCSAHHLGRSEAAHGSDPLAEADASGVRIPDSPDAPVIPPSADHRSPEVVSLVNLWRLDWEKYAANLGGVVGASQTACRRVLNEEHRHLLWSALKNAEYRLLISSDQVTSDVVEPRFLQTLERRLREGRLTVTFVCQRLSEPARQALHPLLAQYRNVFTVVEADSHAKVLIWDDEAVVSSFNFLSFEGVYTGASRRRIRSEIGVHLSGEGIADLVLSAVGVQVPRVAGALPTNTSRRNPPTDDATGPPSELVLPDRHKFSVAVPPLQQLLLDLEAARGRVEERARLFAEFFSHADEASDTPWEALELLQAAGLPHPDLEIAIAACLRDRSRRRTDRHRPWLRILAEGAWNRRLFFDAAAMIAALGDAHRGESLPCLSVAELAALHETGVAFSTRLAETKGTFLTLARADAECVALIALRALAEEGEGVAGELLVSVTTALRPPLRALVDPVISYWKKHGHALPLEDVRALLDWRDTAAAAEEARVEVLAMFKRAADASSDLEIVRGTVGEIFGQGKPLAALLAAAESRDPRLAQRCLTAALGTEADALDQMVDAAVERAQGPGAKLISHRRRNLLSRIEQLVRATRDWIEESAPPPPLGSRFLLEASTSVAEEWRRAEPAVRELVSESETAKTPQAPLLRALLERTAPLMRLQRGEQFDEHRF